MYYLKYFRRLIVLFLIVFFIFSCMSLQRIRLDGSSMEPNYSAGDYFTVIEIDPAELQRGDLVVFGNLPDTMYLKRVIGLPYETIRIEEGENYVNDILLKEPYEVVPPKYQGVYKLNKDEFFVLGYNRNNSADSQI